MNQLSKHDVNKLTAKELIKKLPFQIVSDNEVVAVVLPMKDINKIPVLLEHKGKLEELPLSKSRQAKNLLPKVPF